MQTLFDSLPKGKVSLCNGDGVCVMPWQVNIVSHQAYCTLHVQYFTYII